MKVALLVIVAVALAPLAAVPLAVAEYVGDVTIENTTYRVSHPLKMEPGTTLTIRHSTIIFAGAGITAQPGSTVIVEDSDVIQEAGWARSKLQADGWVTVVRSTFTGTGGFHSQTGTVSITDATFTGNSIGVFVNRAVVADIVRSTFTNNAEGGAQVRDGTMRISDSVFSGNTGQYGSVGFASTLAGSPVFGEARGSLRDSVVSGGSRGVHFQGVDHDKVEIHHNCIFSNAVGLAAQDGSNPNVHHNGIRDNTYGYSNSGNGGTPWPVDATTNWWGSASGPATSGPNAVVATNGAVITTSPFLTANPTPDLCP